MLFRSRTAAESEGSKTFLTQNGDLVVRGTSDTGAEYSLTNDPDLWRLAYNITSVDISIVGFQEHASHALRATKCGLIDVMIGEGAGAVSATLTLLYLPGGADMLLYSVKSLTQQGIYPTYKEEAIVFTGPGVGPKGSGVIVDTHGELYTHPVKALGKESRAKAKQKEKKAAEKYAKRVSGIVKRTEPTAADLPCCVNSITTFAALTHTKTTHQACTNDAKIATAVQEGRSSLSEEENAFMECDDSQEEEKYPMKVSSSESDTDGCSTDDDCRVSNRRGGVTPSGEANRPEEHCVGLKARLNSLDDDVIDALYAEMESSGSTSDKDEIQVCKVCGEGALSHLRLTRGGTGMKMPASAKGRTRLGVENLLHKRFAHQYLSESLKRAFKEMYPSYDANKLDEVCMGCLAKAHDEYGVFKNGQRIVLSYDVFSI